MIQKHRDTLTQIAIDNPGTNGKYKLSSGIIHRNRLVATGINSYKTHPMMINKGYRVHQIHLHAEADAIKNSLRFLTEEELANSIIYVVRVRKISGKWAYGLAKPCCGCMNLINQYSIKGLEYTLDGQI